MAAELRGKIAQGLLHGCLLSLSWAGVYNTENVVLSSDVGSP
jgi:hypothetical protein